MITFDRWLHGAAQRTENERRRVHEDELQESGTAWQMTGGAWSCKCCRCGEAYELPCDTMEVFVGQEFYCGGSPRCCP